MRLMASLAALALGVEMLVVLGSWSLSALAPEVGARSLLSGEGVRWMVRHLQLAPLRPPLVWLLLLGMACGLVKVACPCRLSSLGPNEKKCIIAGGAALAAYAAIILALCLVEVPHGEPAQAVLLSSSGELFPSPFSDGLVPLACTGLGLFGVVYGLVSGRYKSVSDVFQAIVRGLRWMAPLIVLYIIVMHCYSLITYVFS